MMYIYEAPLPLVDCVLSVIDRWWFMRETSCLPVSVHAVKGVMEMRRMLRLVTK
jgi:hypothetical protein